MQNDKGYRQENLSLLSITVPRLIFQMFTGMTHGFLFEFYPRKIIPRWCNKRMQYFFARFIF